MMLHLMAFCARIDAKARENFMFSVVVNALAVALIVPTIAIFIGVLIIYPVLFLTFPLVAFGWILKVGIGK